MLQVKDDARIQLQEHKRQLSTFADRWRRHKAAQALRAWKECSRRPSIASRVFRDLTGFFQVSKTRLLYTGMNRETPSLAGQNLKAMTIQKSASMLHS